MNNPIQYPEIRMTSLYESIFGKKEDITTDIDNSLWSGWDTAVENFDKKVASIEKNGWKHFDWSPDSNNNIIAISFPKLNDLRLSIGCENRQTIAISIIYHSSRIYNKIYIDIDYITIKNYKMYMDNIINAIKMHPEILTKTGTYKWNDFKKYFIDK